MAVFQSYSLLVVVVLTVLTDRGLGDETLFPPSVAPIPASGLIIAKRGEPVTLACNVIGNPPPVVTWMRVEAERKFDQNITTMWGETVSFLKTRRRHAGVYNFTAVNSEGNATGIIRLIAQYEPEMRLLMDIREDHNRGEFECTVYGEPKPEVWWSKNDQRIDATNDRYVQRSNGTRYILLIDNVQVEDLANYTCTANNSIGTYNKTIEMAGVASIASNLNYTLSHNSVTLEWSTVSYPALVYRLRYCNLMTDVWELLLINATKLDDLNYNQTYQLDGLAAGTAYELIVDSENKFGWSKPLAVEFCTLPEEAVAQKNDEVANKSASSSAALSATLILAIALLMY